MLTAAGALPSPTSDRSAPALPPAPQGHEALMQVRCAPALACCAADVAIISAASAAYLSHVLS
jgi:hypothetical protein